MACIGIDDTDSRTQGMCTTWIATEVIEQLGERETAQPYLIRLCPSIPHKTRGNGAVAIHTSAAAEQCVSAATAVVDEWSIADDPHTNPGIVVLPDTESSLVELQEFATTAMKAPVTKERAEQLLADAKGEAIEYGNGRGIIGATAAVGAATAHQNGALGEGKPFPWSYELLGYREQAQWGTDRSFSVSTEELSTLADGMVWDTVDRVTGEAVCVPNSPCPVGFGIRGSDVHALWEVATSITGDSLARTQVFVTNQGSDAHLVPGKIGELIDGRGYRISGTITDAPTTQEGGHVHFRLASTDGSVMCMAFSPTGRFRDHVRALVRGDRVIVDGEMAQGTLKLEKFALVSRGLLAFRPPMCPTCCNRMKSAGRGQGYRCKSCKTKKSGKIPVVRDRDIDRGWYEVPPGARRHLAQPLIRMPTDLPIHPTT